MHLKQMVGIGEKLICMSISMSNGLDIKLADCYRKFPNLSPKKLFRGSNEPKVFNLFSAMHVKKQVKSDKTSTKNCTILN